MDLNKLKEQFTEALETFEDKGQAVAAVKVEKIHEVLAFAKNDPDFQMNLLMDIVAIDYLEQTPRFEVVYLLYSVPKKHRLRLKVRVGDQQALPTASDLYQSADWAEREIFDMYGIQFKNHPNLKRILMFEGFEGHPLRKDYPVNRRQKVPLIEDKP